MDATTLPNSPRLSIPLNETGHDPTPQTTPEPPGVPYSNAQIGAILEKDDIERLDDNDFGANLGQAHIFSTHFARPVDARDSAATAYCLKKLADLMHSLKVKLHAGEDQLRTISEKASDAVITRQAHDTIVTSMLRPLRMCVDTMLVELEMASVRPQQHNAFGRDEAQFVLMANSIGSDLVDAAVRAMREAATLEKGSALPDPFAYFGVVQLRGVVKSFLGLQSYSCVKGLTQEAYRILETVTMRHAQRLRSHYKKPFDVDMHELRFKPIPSVSLHGNQGFESYLVALFKGSCLMTGALGSITDVHGGYCENQHFFTYDHDFSHLLLINVLVTPEHLDAFRPVLDQLTSRHSNISTLDRKKDLLLMFVLFHEDPMFLSHMSRTHRDRHDPTFHDQALAFAGPAIDVHDLIPILNKLNKDIEGFVPIPQVSVPSKDDVRPKRNASTEAVAAALTAMWKEFKTRHGHLLPESYRTFE